MRTKGLPGTTSTGTLLSTTWYYYNDSGNVTRVVTNEAGSDDYSGVRLEYAVNGRAVTYVLGETWVDGGGGPLDYQITYAREFRYDGARQRYMIRVLDPDALEGGSIQALRPCVAGVGTDSLGLN